MSDSQNRIVGIVGRKGAGKSTRTRWLLKYVPRIFVWPSPPACAVLTGFYPIRAAYSYLKRLHGWNLLERCFDNRGLLLYRLNSRGGRRLEWLRRSR